MKVLMISSPKIKSTSVLWLLGSFSALFQIGQWTHFYDCWLNKSSIFFIYTSYFISGFCKIMPQCVNWSDSPFFSQSNGSWLSVATTIQKSVQIWLVLYVSVWLIVTRSNFLFEIEPIRGYLHLTDIYLWSLQNTQFIYTF